MSLFWNEVFKWKKNSNNNSSSNVETRSANNEMELREKKLPNTEFEDTDILSEAALPPPKTIRQKIFYLFEYPQSSKVALGISCFVMFVIVLSTITFLLGSLPQHQKNSPDILEALEIFSITVFTMEYVVRLLTAPLWYKWMLDPLNIIDLLAIIPFYLELGIGSGASAIAVVRVIRLLRVFRVFKVGKYSTSLQVIIKVFKMSKDGLLLMLFLVTLVLIIFSTILFYAEKVDETFDDELGRWTRNSDGEESPFQSIVSTFWWCIATITTVGYGDVHPVTWLGKIVASITMLSGILVLAFPISIVGSNFTDEWKAMKDEISRKERRKKLQEMRDIGNTNIKKILRDIMTSQSELEERMKEMDKSLNSMKESYTNNTLLLEALLVDPKIRNLLLSEEEDKYLSSDT